ncbi:putative Isoprenylcysteine carboxyl methyltransferase [Candidatus Sulfopaludibacter sp. SbA4]|nr:putative Isoprenylcysteine carboxyl methyltransferase [Candidatus Sulfopaludibacter sp. SbA4]
MDAVRYYAALLLLMLMPGGLLYWCSIHPLIHFWRRIGPRKTIAVHLAGLTLLAYLFYLLRKPLLAVEFGSRPAFLVPGLLLIALSVAMRARVSRHLTGKILTGMPELAPDKYPVHLLTDGPYARVRNPRYLQILVAILGWALFSNYLSSYVLFAASVILLQVVIRLEEKELRSRFGPAFDEYCARVPRLVPHGLTIGFRKELG